MLNEDINEAINLLVSKVGQKKNQKYIKEILTTICKIPQIDIDSGEWKLLSRTIKELKNSFQRFAPYKEKRKVAIFGSARTIPSNPLFKLTEEFSKLMTQNDFMVITGAGGGIMEAGNKGGGDESFGLNIRLPFEQSANEYIKGNSKLVSYNYFFTRKLMFIKESDATVLFPGGFGTLDEAYEGLTLIQTGKSLPRPIILMQNPGDDYWQTWVSFFTEIMLRDKYISPDDMDLFTICESKDDAVKIITSFYKNYHSLRYVGDYAVLRLNKEITADNIKKLNDHFSDIVVEGDIQQTEPFPDEVATRDQLKKFRIAFKFNKINFGRLVSMVHMINSF
ncbi:MAG: LOG family protein [Candidatus Margulisiibacteriota bacterium]|nr:LOG family protein [Candidatus Margulisiibacteriota bacterium]